MSIPGAWIIAPKGRGTEADAAAIERLVIDAAPKWERVRPYQRDIIEFFRRPWDGPRLIWVVGIACDDPMGDKCLRTDDASDGLPLANLGRLLLEAADATRHPIVAILDVCHARYASPPRAPQHQNLAVFFACDHHELTPADDRGGWLTRTLIEGLTTLPGAIDLHTLVGFVNRRREQEQLGGIWPNASLGRLATFVLNTKEEAREPEVDPSKRIRTPEAVPTFLVRVTSGKVLFDLAAGSDGIQQDFSHDLNPEEAKLVAEFVQGVQDWADIAGDIGLGGQVDAAQSLGDDLRRLAEKGLMVFIAREKQLLVCGKERLPFYLLHLSVVRETDPQVIRVGNRGSVDIEETP